MGYLPIYTSQELTGFAVTYASERTKQNVAQIINAVWSDVLKRARTGYYTSTTDITSGCYTLAEIQESETQLLAIFPGSTIVNFVQELNTQKFVVTWPSP